MADITLTREPTASKGRYVGRIAGVEGEAELTFSRANPQLVIKGGVLDGRFLSPDDVRNLADLESREVLLAKVAGALQGVLQQAISLVSAPLSQTARLFAALEQAAGENPSLLAAAPDEEPEQSQEPTNEELAAQAAQPAASAAAEAGTEPASDPLAASAAEDN